MPSDRNRPSVPLGANRGAFSFGAVSNLMGTRMKLHGFGPERTNTPDALHPERGPRWPLSRKETREGPHVRQDLRQSGAPRATKNVSS